jgi:hypothetical protein
MDTGRLSYLRYMDGVQEVGGTQKGPQLGRQVFARDAWSDLACHRQVPEQA